MDSWKRRTIIQPATRHSGTLTRKIHRQLVNSEKTPPRVGPTTLDTAHTLARYPCVFARSATV
jgi:hypothetical protein